MIRLENKEDRHHVHPHLGQVLQLGQIRHLTQIRYEAPPAGPELVGLEYLGKIRLADL